MSVTANGKSALNRRPHRRRRLDSRSRVCSTTPASPRIYTQEGHDHTGSGYTLQSQRGHHVIITLSDSASLNHQPSLRRLRDPLSLTADLVWAAADVVCQADDHLPGSMAHRRHHVGAVVLHRNDGVVVAAVHAAGVLGGFPDLAVCTRDAGAVGAGCKQQPRSVFR